MNRGIVKERAIKLGALALVVLFHCPVASAEGRWAAMDPNSESTGSVQWGQTRDEAVSRAMASCKAISNTCASLSAWTDNPNNMFVTMCCLYPQAGCQTSVSATVEQGEAKSRAVFEKAGYRECSLRRAVSARTGLPVH